MTAGLVFLPLIQERNEKEHLILILYHIEQHFWLRLLKETKAQFSALQKLPIFHFPSKPPAVTKTNLLSTCILLEAGGKQVMALALTKEKNTATTMDHRRLLTYQYCIIYVYISIIYQLSRVFWPTVNYFTLTEDNPLAFPWFSNAYLNRDGFKSPGSVEGQLDVQNDVVQKEITCDSAIFQ